MGAMSRLIQVHLIGSDDNLGGGISRNSSGMGMQDFRLQYFGRLFLLKLAKLHNLLRPAASLYGPRDSRK